MQKTKRCIGVRGDSKGVCNRVAGLAQGKSKKRANKDGLWSEHNRNQITPREILRQEFIGREIEVIDSKNQNLIGIKGKITDETRNTLEIDNTKKLVKGQITFKIKKDHQSFMIDGAQIIGRPEDRVKKIRKT